MNRIFVLIAALLFAVSASAAELRWQIETVDGVVTFTSPTISEANIDRFLDYVWAEYPQVDVNGDPLPKTPANLAAAYRAWGNAQWFYTRKAVLDYERTQAAIAAKDAVPDIQQ